MSPLIRCAAEAGAQNAAALRLHLRSQDPACPMWCVLDLIQSRMSRSCSVSQAELMTLPSLPTTLFGGPGIGCVLPESGPWFLIHLCTACLVTRQYRAIADCPRYRLSICFLPPYLVVPSAAARRLPSMYSMAVPASVLVLPMNPSPVSGMKGGTSM